MHSESTGLDRYSERKERVELERDCAGMHAGGRYTRSNALLIAYGAPVPCGHVSSMFFKTNFGTQLSGAKTKINDSLPCDIQVDDLHYKL